MSLNQPGVVREDPRRGTEPVLVRIAIGGSYWDHARFAAESQEEQQHHPKNKVFGNGNSESLSSSQVKLKPSQAFNSLGFQGTKQGKNCIIFTTGRSPTVKTNTQLST